MTKLKQITLSGIVLALATVPGLAAAQYEETIAGPVEDVAEAVAVVEKMRTDGDLGAAIAASKGVFIIPDYATAALGVGGAGGEGVLVANQMGDWSDPIFYDIGSISIGIQAGVAAGSMALLLMSDDAISNFLQENNFSLNAELGLTFIAWSAEAEGDWGRGDVIVWSDVEGLMGQLALGVSDINFDEEETLAYYNIPATPVQILAGEVVHSHAPVLQTEFAEFTSL